MGIQVKLAMIEFRERSDNELMARYIKHVLSPFPFMVEVEALNNIFKERNIIPKGLEISFVFEKDGVEKVINSKATV